jgi:hypothetical protein
MANEMMAKEFNDALDGIKKKYGRDEGIKRIMDVLKREAAGDDDRGRGRDRRHDDAEDRHQRARDSARRWADDEESDPEEMLEALLESFGPELASSIRECADRGPHAFVKDRRERREARDYRGSGFRHYGDGRRLSRDVDWGPYQNEPGPALEDFSARRGQSKRDETEPLGDRRRANDRALALDAGASGENLTFGTLANRSKPAETQASSRYHPLRSHH